MVFVDQSKLNKKILKYILILLIVAVLVTLYNILFLNYDNTQYTWLECLEEVGYNVSIIVFPYVFIIGVINLINYIYQKILVKKLNAELKGEIDIKKLDKKIGITIIVVSVLFFIITIIGLIVFNAAYVVY